jgi:putative NADH-flavin reductase
VTAIRREVVPLRILVLGAGGRVGREVVGQALGHGHHVTAFVRDPAAFELRGDRLRVAAGDVTRAADVQAAVEGQDAVVSVVGSRHERPVHVYSDGAANTVRAMTARGVSRLVVLSAVGVGSEASALPLAQRVRAALPWVQAAREDMERMEGDVLFSDLDWTVVRAATLTDGPFTGRYRAVEGSAVPKGSRISRADVAALMLKCAEGELYSRRTVAVAY